MFRNFRIKVRRIGLFPHHIRGHPLKTYIRQREDGFYTKFTIVDKGERGGPEFCTYTYFKTFIAEITHKSSLQFWNRYSAHLHFLGHTNSLKTLVTIVPFSIKKADKIPVPSQYSTSLYSQFRLRYLLSKLIAI